MHKIGGRDSETRWKPLTKSMIKRCVLTIINFSHPSLRLEAFARERSVALRITADNLACNTTGVKTTARKSRSLEFEVQSIAPIARSSFQEVETEGFASSGEWTNARQTIETVARASLPNKLTRSRSIANKSDKQHTSVKNQKLPDGTPEEQSSGEPRH